MTKKDREWTRILNAVDEIPKSFLDEDHFRAYLFLLWNGVSQLGFPDRFTVQDRLINAQEKLLAMKTMREFNEISHH
jgi:hypothetical protein